VWVGLWGTVPGSSELKRKERKGEEMNLSLGVQLARDILRVEKKLDMMIQNNELNFDVYEEDGKGVIVTAICNVGGCNAETSNYGSLKEAQRQAALWTLVGKHSHTVGICQECRNSSSDFDTCPNCGEELELMYDEHPNWIKFCPKCDTRV